MTSATDNRTTELTATDRLRELLDERGVEYETDERNAITEWSTHYGAFVFFARQREGKLLVETTVATKHSVILTPEQAIAATLGNGTLTAEQVEQAVRRNIAFCECDKEDVQAIADELNAELGSGTCEPKWTLQGETQTQEFWRCDCGNCEECFGVESRESFPLNMTVGKVDIPNYCPNCGHKVVYEC